MSHESSESHFYEFVIKNSDYSGPMLRQGIAHFMLLDRSFGGWSRWAFLHRFDSLASPHID